MGKPRRDCTRERRQFRAEFKLEAVRLMRERRPIGACLSQVGRELDVGPDLFPAARRSILESDIKRDRLVNTHLDALALLRQATEKHHMHLSVLVAETCLWAHPDVYKRLVAENGTGCYFPGTRRARAGAGERPSQVLNGERLDNNTYANHAAKRAVGFGRGAVGFEVCHV